MSNTTRRFLMAASAGGAETKYVENNFSTQVYRGTGVARSIVSGVDLSTDGGLVLTKNRTGTNTWYWGSPGPSTLGVGKYINSTSIAQAQTDTQGYTAFNDDGYNIGTSAGVNGNGDDMVGFSFRKTPGILDVVQFVGNGVSGRTIPHNLGSTPGWMVIMCTTKSENKSSWHRSLYNANWLYMDAANGASNGNNAFPQPPTSTQFTIGTYNNISGETYVAWIFGGGEQQGNSSVQFNGIDDDIKVSSEYSDLAFGTGDFTVECWAKWDTTPSNARYLIDMRSGNGVQAGSLAIGYSGDTTKIEWATTSNALLIQATWSTYISVGNWYHIAVARSGSTTKMYINGTEVASGTDNYNYSTNPNYNITIGNRYVNSASSQWFDGWISNVRLTKGQALYTSNFTPSTSPLTTTSQGATDSNVKVLCCNDTGASGFTRTANSGSKGGGLTLNGNYIVGSTDSPFASGTSTDAGAIFGANEDKSLIKCGSYIGNGSSSGQRIDIGWEPQWVLIKNATSGGNGWMMYDNMRGWFNNDGDRYMMLNSTNAETTFDSSQPSSRGFDIVTNNPAFNANQDIYCYVAIRRSDPEVGIPPKAGTDVFNVVYGNSSSIIPNFASTFRVDMGVYKQPLTSYSWYTHTRLTGYYNLKTDSPDTQKPASPGDADATFDAETGWGKFGYNTDKASWMWKRHAGFDVVCYTGTGDNSNSGPNSTSQTLSHNLGRIPEMIWVKCRSTGYNWYVYHSGQNGGTNPQNYYLQLNATDAEQESVAPYTNAMWNNTAPTSTQFSLGPGNDINANNEHYTAMLFASVDGISKVGSYDGTDTTQTITTGFSPRFVILKRVNTTGSWFVLDTTRGWSSGNDNFLLLNSSAAQDGNYNLGEPTATGFTLTGNDSYNNAGDKFIYYAHA